MKKPVRKPKLSTLRRSVHKHGDTMPTLGPPKLFKPPKFTVKRLMTFTDNNRQKKAQLDLAIKGMRVGFIRKNSQLPPNTKYYKVDVYNKKKRHLHPVTVILYDGNEFSSNSKVVISCACKDFVYRWEVALARRTGCAFIWRSNGDMPIETNPGLVPGMCGHCYRALKYMRKASDAGSLIKTSKSKTQFSSTRG